MEARLAQNSRLAWRLRRQRAPLFWQAAPPDPRFYLDRARLHLTEWRLPFWDGGPPFVVVDVETTGLSPQKNGVTEVAFLRFEGGELLRFSAFVNPGEPVPPFITRLTGIRNEDVVGAPPLEEVLLAARPYWTDALWVAHNAPFDLGFLRPALKRLGYRMDFKVLDTLSWARSGLPALRRYGLDHLRRVLALPSERAHRAYADVEATYWLLHELYYLVPALKESV